MRVCSGANFRGRHFPAEKSQELNRKVGQESRGHQHAAHVGDHPAHVGHHRQGGHFPTPQFVVTTLVIGLAGIPQRIIHPDLELPIHMADGIDQLDFGGIVLRDVGT